jgi:hypothetical protein
MISSSPLTAPIRSRMLIRPIPSGRLGIFIPTPSSITSNRMPPAGPV